MSNLRILCSNVCITSLDSPSSPFNLPVVKWLFDCNLVFACSASRFDLDYCFSLFFVSVCLFTFTVVEFILHYFCGCYCSTNRAPGEVGKVLYKPVKNTTLLFTGNCWHIIPEGFLLIF